MAGKVKLPSFSKLSIARLWRRGPADGKGLPPSTGQNGSRGLMTQRLREQAAVAAVAAVAAANEVRQAPSSTTPDQPTVPEDEPLPPDKVWPRLARLTLQTALKVERSAGVPAVEATVLVLGA